MRSSPGLRSLLLTFVALMTACGTAAGVNARAIATSEPTRAKLALVIDDIGYNMDLGRRAIELAGPVTLAVIPFTPDAQALAELARQAGKDVILHQPMQAIRPHHRFNTAHTLTLAMSAESFRHAFKAALDSLPGVVGVNNHTGSLLTQRRLPMTRLMQQIRARHLFFLDSRTTKKTIAATVARENGVPVLQRDVFLDHPPQPSAIAAAFRHALRLARIKGHAVIIAHPHEATLDFLKHAIAAIDGARFTWVAARTLAYPAVAPSQTLTMQLAAGSATPGPQQTQGSLHTAPAH